MSNSFVVDLQKKAIDTNFDIVELVRTAYLISGKLGLSDFNNWLEKELKGYGASDKLPNYRILNGRLYSDTGYGKKPVILQDCEDSVEKLISESEMRLPITCIVDLINDQNSDYVEEKLSSECINEFNRASGNKNYNFFIWHDKYSFKRIIDAVRNIILDWSIKLENEGIIDNELIFSDRDKKLAQTTHTINFNVTGNIENSNIQIGTDCSIKK